jgi:hypothetical protein
MSLRPGPVDATYASPPFIALGGESHIPCGEPRGQNEVTHWRISHLSFSGQPSNAHAVMKSWPSYILRLPQNKAI